MGTPVFLNVYDLVMSEGKAAGLGRDALDLIGMGVFHTGVEVYGEEYSFGMDPTGVNNPATEGVFVVAPRTAVGLFKQQISLGTVSLSVHQVRAVVDSLRPEWKACTYQMLGRNCNHFTKTLAKALNPTRLNDYPAWVNRIAKTGNFVLPNVLINKITDAVAPPPAGPSEFQNQIHLPYEGLPPPPLPPSARASRIDFNVQFLGKFISAAAKTAGDLLGESDQKEFNKLFPEGAGIQVLDKYDCEVIHINKVQKAVCWIGSLAIGFTGPRDLHVLVPLASLQSLQYGKVTEMPGSPTPTFNLCEPERADAVMLFIRGNAMIPIFNPGTLFEKAKGWLTGTPTQKLFSSIDVEWRRPR
jgi:hypothetical protein